MSLWAFGNILWVRPLQLACFVQSFLFICIAVCVYWFDISGLPIFYLTLFLVFGVCFVFLGFLAGCSCTNVWYGAPVPESYLAAAERAFMAIVLAVEMTGFRFGASTWRAPSA